MAAASKSMTADILQSVGTEAAIEKEQESAAESIDQERTVETLDTTEPTDPPTEPAPQPIDPLAESAEPKVAEEQVPKLVAEAEVPPAAVPSTTAVRATLLFLP